MSHQFNAQRFNARINLCKLPIAILTALCYNDIISYGKDALHNVQQQNV